MVLSPVLLYLRVFPCNTDKDRPSIPSRSSEISPDQDTKVALCANIRQKVNSVCTKTHSQMVHANQIFTRESIREPLRKCSEIEPRPDQACNPEAVSELQRGK